MEPKPMLKSLGETFGIATCTVSDMIKKRAMYKSEYEKNASGNKRSFNNGCKCERWNELESITQDSLSNNDVTGSNPQWMNLLKWSNYSV